jgi:carboxyl-terminal processing protease
LNLQFRPSSASLLALSLPFFLAACGGGGGDAPSVAEPPPVSYTPPPDRVVQATPAQGAWALEANRCVAPRTGLQPNGKPYPDRQGTLRNEQDFLRSWIHDTYLWYNEVPNYLDPAWYDNAIDYFNMLKSQDLTSNGKVKDQFHFTYTSAQWEQLQTAGVSLGYGVTWGRNQATVPRMWFASMVEPGSPAEKAGVRRGDQLMEIDGIDFINGTGAANVAILNAGLAPAKVGDQHTFVLRRDGQPHTVVMAGANVAATPVQNVKTIPTANGKVGYLTFNNHNAVSELQLIEAFTRLRDDKVDDLVLDLRYNGGGLLFIASQVAYMIAGPTQTLNKTFERTIYNEKVVPATPIPFWSFAWGFPSPRPAQGGQMLPYLGLKKVTILTTPGTCSASESIINSLRGIDVEVNLIGGQTCGKPYGFVPQPNCGTTYFAIQLKGVNHKGFGDYADGMAPTCTVADDYGHALGDPNEGMLAAALRYRERKQCDAGSRASAKPLILVRDRVNEIKVLPERW